MITLIPFRFIILALLLLSAAYFGGINWFIGAVVFFALILAFA